MTTAALVDHASKFPGLPFSGRDSESIGLVVRLAFLFLERTKSMSRQTFPKVALRRLMLSMYRSSGRMPVLVPNRKCIE